MERVQSCVEVLELDGKATHRVSPPDDRDRSDGLASIMEKYWSSMARHHTVCLPQMTVTGLMVW
jgi:hypothetical protein